MELTKDSFGNVMLSANQVAEIKESLETLNDLSTYSDATFAALMKDGGGYEDPAGNYFGDDEASWCWSLNRLNEIFGVTRDIIERYRQEDLDEKADA